MKLSQESKDNIRKAYNIGDLHWLEIIQEELKKYKETELIKSDVAYDWEEFEKAEKLLYAVFRMNYVIIETEMEEYASKYNTQAQDLYSEMKIDLTKMIGYEEMWEEL